MVEITLKISRGTFSRTPCM